MDSETPKTLIEHFSVLEDPRGPTRRRHLLIEVIVMAVTAVICGADGWSESPLSYSL
jgi:hypothetical protein